MCTKFRNLWWTVGELRTLSLIFPRAFLISLNETRRNSNLTPLLIITIAGLGAHVNARQAALSTAPAVFESLPHARSFLGPLTQHSSSLHFYSNSQQHTIMPPTRPSTATATPPYPSSRPGSSRPDSPAKSATANSSLILRKQLMGTYATWSAEGRRAS